MIMTYEEQKEGVTVLGTIPLTYATSWTKFLDITVARAFLNQTGIASYLRKCHPVLAFQPISAGPTWGALAYAYLYAGRGCNTLYQSREILPAIKT
jgi:hypothetical protein